MDAMVTTSEKPMTAAEREAIAFSPRVLQLVRQLAKKMSSRWVGDVAAQWEEQLYQAGLIAAWEGAARYDPAMGCEPAAYLYRRIAGAMSDLGRYEGHVLGWGVRSKSDGTQTCAHEPIFSLDTPTSSLLGKPMVYSQLLTDGKSDELADDRRTEFKAWLKESWPGLMPSERHALNLYFCQGLTMLEVGRRLKISESRVSQLINATLNTMRETGLGLKLRELKRVRDRKILPAPAQLDAAINTPAPRGCPCDVPHTGDRSHDGPAVPTDSNRGPLPEASQ